MNKILRTIIQTYQAILTYPIINAKKHIPLHIWIEFVKIVQDAPI